MSENPAEIFWHGCAKREIRYQDCGECGNVLTYPRAFCPACGSPKVDWKTSSGSGTVEAKTVVTRAPSPVFEAITPYALLLVRIDERLTIMAHGDLDLTIGQAVTADFREIDGKALPYFRPSSGRSNSPWL